MWLFGAMHMKGSVAKYLTNQLFCDTPLNNIKYEPSE